MTGMDDYGAFVVTVPKPKGTEWPVLKSGQQASHEYEASEHTPPHRMHTDPPCTCGEAKNHPDHK